jgi:hypothetical protein
MSLKHLEAPKTYEIVLFGQDAQRLEGCICVRMRVNAGCRAELVKLGLYAYPNHQSMELDVTIERSSLSCQRCVESPADCSGTDLQGKISTAQQSAAVLRDGGCQRSPGRY